VVAFDDIPPFIIPLMTVKLLGDHLSAHSLWVSVVALFQVTFYLHILLFIVPRKASKFAQFEVDRLHIKVRNKVCN